MSAGFRVHEVPAAVHGEVVEHHVPQFIVNRPQAIMAFPLVQNDSGSRVDILDFDGVQRSPVPLLHLKQMKLPTRLPYQADNPRTLVLGPAVVVAAAPRHVVAPPEAVHSRTSACPEERLVHLDDLADPSQWRPTRQLVGGGFPDEIFPVAQDIIPHRENVLHGFCCLHAGVPLRQGGADPQDLPSRELDVGVASTST